MKILLFKKQFENDNFLSIHHISHHICKEEKNIYFMPFFSGAAKLILEVKGMFHLEGFMDCVIIYSMHDSDTNYFWFLIWFSFYAVLFIPKEADESKRSRSCERSRVFL